MKNARHCWRQMNSHLSDFFENSLKGIKKFSFGVMTRRDMYHKFNELAKFLFVISPPILIFIAAIYDLWNKWNVRKTHKVIGEFDSGIEIQA
jgi:hypothetical protein